MNNELHRGTGLIWIEAINSNPNGDPDRDSDPRRKSDGRGEISPVSLKHKIRELVADKGGPLWQEVSAELGIAPQDAARYDVLERQGIKRNEVNKLSQDEFLDRFWDARVFGSTFLEEGSAKKDSDAKSTFIHTGVVQFGMGVSLSPIEVERLTTTKVLPAQEGKDKGMAPLAYRIVTYGLYTMPFFVNATAARRTQCTKLDIELLLRILPFAYQETASYLRSQVNIRHAFYVEHAKARGCYNDFEIIDALTPKACSGGPARSFADYDADAVLDAIGELNGKMGGKAGSVRDLVEER